MRFEWNLDAFEEIRRSPETQSLVEDECSRVAAEASRVSPLAKYEASVKQGKSRVHGIVYPKNARAARSNAKHNTLLKVLGS